MRSVEDWLAEYGTSHQNPVNKTLHFVCVPLIVLAILGLLWSLPVPAAILRHAPRVNWALVAMAAGLVYYAFLSASLALGMLLPLAVAAALLTALAARAAPLAGLCLGVFVLAWIGQFVGHAVEGRRPSFFKDVQFLLIGPLWILAFVYRRLGLRY